MGNRKATAAAVRSKLHLLQQTKRKVYPVEKGLKSEESAKQYRWHLNAFIRWVEAKYSATIIDEMLLQLDVHELESLLIEYLDEHLHKQRGLKHSTIKTAEAAIIHFCSINDVLLNTHKISKFVPADENSNQDRAYTRKEIEKLYDTADERYKVVILLLANGMRIGAISDLRLGDLTPISLGENQKVYKIWVYNRSPKARYYTFVTPECAKAIDNYLLEFRKKQGEKDINLQTSPISPPDTPLIREQFKLGDRRQAATPRKVSQPTLEKTIERIVKRAGINTVHKVMVTHGFRKWAITQMAKAKVDFSDREYLVGHKVSRGLDVNYHRTTEDEKLVEWSKSINNLTINSEYHLQHELNLVQGETNQKIAWQAQEIQELKAQLAAVQNKMAAVQNKIYERDRRRMGIDVFGRESVAEGKKKDITKEEWLDSINK